MFLFLRVCRHRTTKTLYGVQFLINSGARAANRRQAVSERMHYKSGDYRYTYRPCHIYAFALTKRKQKVFRLKKLGLSRDNFHFIIQGVKVLGYSDKVQWKISKKYLELRLEKPLDTKMPVCFEIKVD